MIKSASPLRRRIASRKASAEWALVAVMALAVVGCERPATTIPAVPALPPNDTPEGKLARVMQRLDSALESAQAASGSGVMSERRAYHRLVRPDGEDGPYEAIVTIETKRALAPRALNDAAQAKLEAEAEKRGEDPADLTRKPMIVKDPEQIETVDYRLVYEGDRWKLAEGLKPSENGELKIEQIFFEYALGGNE